MKKLEYYILKIFQNQMLTGGTGINYIKLEENLFAVIKRDPKSTDLYVSTECILDGRKLSLLEFEYLDDGFYKVLWNEKFKYLTNESDYISSSLYSKELELIRNSENPLTNYIKTL